jgi:hypothetical protein
MELDRTAFQIESAGVSQVTAQRRLERCELSMKKAIPRRECLKFCFKRKAASVD